MGFTTIQTSFNDVEANLAKSRLELAGFNPHLKDENATMLTATPNTTGGIKIQVPDEEADKAAAYLKDEAEENAASEDS